MRVVPPESPRLSVTKVKGGGNAEGKVASGMEVVYTVTFLPDEECRHEYKDHILVCTERETFAVPVLAVGMLFRPIPFPRYNPIYHSCVVPLFILQPLRPLDWSQPRGSATPWGSLEMSRIPPLRMHCSTCHIDKDLDGTHLREQESSASVDIRRSNLDHVTVRDTCIANNN